MFPSSGARTGGAPGLTRTAFETIDRIVGVDGGDAEFHLKDGTVRRILEVARLLKPGGRLALADIVTEVPLAENVVCNTDLWAARIGGAAEQQKYRSAIETSGLVVERAEENDRERFYPGAKVIVGRPVLPHRDLASE